LIETPHYPLVPRTPQENLAFRREMIRRGSEDADFAKTLRRMCGEDPLFWWGTFAMTFDPRKQPSAIPFNLYGFQEETVLDLIGCIRNGEDLAVTKSRDMGASWMVIGVPFWLW
jgi:hypothetical protein